MTRVLHLAGPGGAGKTTVGAIVARKLGWPFVDLDQRFMASEGSIPAYIEAAGYEGYAKRNISIYREARDLRIASIVLALSSGFLTYPEEVEPGYEALRSSIAADSLTALLLPTFELETCVEAIIQRQLCRPYLAGNRKSEERRIRERFPKYMALSCARFRSDAAPGELALQIERFARARLAVSAQAR